ncbi:unannotated protein [freshwater metagenome]|uniref:Unannotated protein n=1 Tax=freshwater metagenome TaxID=449393 RepID=A0A6J6S7I8_9ZZZZ
MPCRRPGGARAGLVHPGQPGFGRRRLSPDPPVSGGAPYAGPCHDRPHRARDRADRLPRPRCDHPDGAGSRGGDDRAPAHGRQPELAARLRSARAPGRGGVARDDRARHRLPSRRGGVHLRRHGGRQPRGQGHLLVATGRRPPAHPDPVHAGRAPRRPRPARLAGRLRGRGGRAAAGGLRRPARPRGRPDGDRARPRLGRAGLGDVGQQRGRHGAAGRRRRGDRGPARHPCAHRRRPGAGIGAGRLRDVGGRRPHRHRAQGGWAVRRRRARRAPRGRRNRLGARRRPGARHPQRHHRHPGDRGIRPRRRARCEAPARARVAGGGAARPARGGSAGGSAGSAPQRQHRPPSARQRPLQLPGLRG